MFLDQQILEWLVARKKVTGKQANHLLAASEGQSLEMLLVERGMLDKQSLLDIKAMLCELPPVDLGSCTVDLAVVRMLPASMSRKFMAVAYRIEEERLMVALANPTDPFARYFLSMRTNREIDMRVAYLGDVQTLQDRAYPSEEPEVLGLPNLAPDATPSRATGIQVEASYSTTSRRVNLPQAASGERSVNSGAGAATHSLGRPQGPRPIQANADAPPARLRGGALAGLSPGPPSAPTPDRAQPPANAAPLPELAAERPDMVVEPRRGDTGRLEGLPDLSRRETEMSYKREGSNTARLEQLKASPPEPFKPDPDLRASVGVTDRPQPTPVVPTTKRIETQQTPSVPTTKRIERQSLELPSVGGPMDPRVENSHPVQAPPTLAGDDEIELVWEEDLSSPAPAAPAVVQSLLPKPAVERSSSSIGTWNSALLDTLSAMAINLSESGRLAYVLPQVLQTARTLTNADATAFLLCETDRRYISYYATHGGGVEATQYAVPFDESTIVGWSVIRGEGIAVRCLRTDSRFNMSAEQAAGLKTGGTVCVPVRWGPDVLGALVACVEDERDLDIRVLTLLAAPLGAALRARQMETSIHDIRMETVQSLLDWNEVGSPGARQHGAEVAQLATAMARYLALPPSEIEEICFAALLHDVGLTPDRERDGPEHPQKAGQILQKIRILQKMIPLVRYHHERYDGKGYPHGLKGEAIPLGARLLAVAESYCEGGLHKVARDAPELESFLDRFGTEFDPTLKAAFIRAVNLDRKR